MTDELNTLVPADLEDDLLRVEDIDDLPNGYATVLEASRKLRKESETARIDENGFVRGLTNDLYYLRDRWRAEPRGDA